MITWKDYRKHNEDYWKGKKVITLREMKNGWFVIPMGTILKIDRKYCGFSLEGLEVCKHCKIGRRISIGRVEPTALRLKINEEA